MYAGQPGPAVGHAPPSTARATCVGNSFFDRLWRKGASKHASVDDRYVLHLARNDKDIPRRAETVPYHPIQEDAPQKKKKKKRVPTGGKYGPKPKKKKVA